MAEREPWELSNEESFSKGASGGAWAAAFVSATIAFLPASFGLGEVVPQLPLCRGWRIWSSHQLLSRNLNPFPEHAEKRPYLGTPRRVPETHAFSRTRAWGDDEWQRPFGLRRESSVFGLRLLRQRRSTRLEHTAATAASRFRSTSSSGLRVMAGLSLVDSFDGFDHQQQQIIERTRALHGRAICATANRYPRETG